ncbi:cytochrome aa3 quinol oxidase subunit IV [Fictibacillus iocasae]|uniref:Quinol oxidase subunit 4 n=1 Tax=Fictibacillus iocasae TaxID=2715437 RepID=A0ABW2P032_9BACL
MANPNKRFPMSHVIGLVLSIVMTLAAAWAALESDLSRTVVLVIIVVLAILQAMLQLFMFMHMTESENGVWQTLNIAYAFFIAITVVAGSVWVMYFGIHGYH